MIEKLQDHNLIALLGRLGRISQTSADAYLEAAHDLLQQVVSNQCFLGGISFDRKSGAFARSLVYGDENLSFWAIAWPPGSKTSIHDHHCSCCFGVLSGSLVERRFSAAHEAHAVLAQEMVRGPGFITCFLPSGPNIHQMSNESDGEAVSLHLYGFDHRMHASSIDREYQSL